MTDLADDVDVDDDEPFMGKYEGDRNERNERHGFGKAVLHTKDIYEGNYMNGKRQGYGVYKFMSKAARKARYMGDYHQARKQGYGVFIYPDGSRYAGNWLNDLKEGTGTYSYVNGDTYEGDWFQDKRHGNGTYTFGKSFVKYVGSWHKGKMQGFGSFIYPNFRYQGRFRSSKAFGGGKYVFDTSCEIHGKYVLPSKYTAAFSDIEQEAALMSLERAMAGDGEDGEVNVNELQLPGTPPDIEDETMFIAGVTTGLHVMTEEEAEESRLLDELTALRAKLEAQLETIKEMDRKKAEEEAAKKARLEAERAALENQVQDELQSGEEGDKDHVEGGENEDKEMKGEDEPMGDKGKPDDEDQEEDNPQD